MSEAERKQLIEKHQEIQDLNKELMVLNADYEDLKKNLLKLGEKIFKFKTKIDNKLDGNNENEKPATSD